MLGWACNWNWNIWCRKYTLWGLLESYELTQEKETLTGAIRMADHLLEELDSNGIDILKTGTYCGILSCSIMKPMLILYSHTNNHKYLDFCIQIANRWNTPEMPGLIHNSLAMKRIDTWYENTLAWSKTYEVLSCFDGLLQLYRITGNPDYLQASQNFYELMEISEKNLLFSVGYNDQFYSAADEINVLTEPCDVIHYIRVCYELFKLTGEIKYMDSVELIYYNAFLAAACKDGKWGARTVRGSGKQEYALYQAQMNHSHCCVNNMPRGFLNAAECCVLATETDVLINMYHPYEANISVGNTKVGITTSGNYVADSRANVHITFDGQPVDLLFRIPSWSKQSFILFNGAELEVTSGIHRIDASAIEALLAASGTQSIYVEVIFDNTPNILPFTKPVIRHNPTEYQYRRWGSAETYEQALGRTFLDTPRCIIQKGVILLCRSKLIGNKAEEMFDGKQLIHADVSCTLQEYKEEADVMASYIAHFTDNKTGETLFSTKVCDYASAANIMQDDPEYFSIYF